MRRIGWLGLGLVLGTGLVLLAWWGWQRGGLALMELGMGAC
ncbi:MULTISPECIES: hypothetical protein [unclassified Pseudomonas]|nr:MULTISPECIES: hypothetical protein [unclassified Pseudomonas]